MRISNWRGDIVRRNWIRRQLANGVLRGKDQVCWCADEPNDPRLICHAQVLMDLGNR